MDIYNALHSMKVLSEVDAPFSITFLTYNRTKRNSNGFRTVEGALLRPALKNNPMLVSYTDLSDNSAKFFYLPLLVEFNQNKIK